MAASRWTVGPFLAVLIALSSVVAAAGAAAASPSVTPPASYGFVAPSASQTVGGSRVDVETTESWGTLDGIDQCDADTDFRLDGVSLPDSEFTPTEDNGLGPYEWTWDALSVSTGSHVLEAICTEDDNDGVPVSASETIQVDNTGDIVAVTSPSSGATVSGSFVALAATAEGDVALDSQIKKVTFFVDGVSVGSDTVPPYVLDWDSSRVPNGEHQVSATAVDTAGFAATATENINVVNDPTDTTLVGPAFTNYHAETSIESHVYEADSGAKVNGLHVSLYERPVGGSGWALVGHGTTNQAGLVTWRPRLNYSAEFYVATAASGPYLASSSRILTVRARSVVGIAVSTHHAELNQNVTVTVKLSPATSGQRLTLQYFHRGTWKSFLSFRSAAGGKTRRKIFSNVAATYQLRVICRAHAGLAMGASRTVSVRFNGSQPA